VLPKQEAACGVAWRNQSIWLAANQCGGSVSGGNGGIGINKSA